MERLTFEGNFCEDIALCGEVPFGSYCEDGTCWGCRTWKRLKAIEDILGDEYDLDRLRELVQADVAPVVHAYWELREIKNGLRYWICWKCRNRRNTWWAHDRYCSDCGAKMDGRV